MKMHCSLVIASLLTSTVSLRAQPAASLGKPMPAATMGAPITTTSFKPTVRGAAPDPLVGDYIPAARLGPISEVRFGPDPANDSFSSPEERYNWGLPERAPRNDYRSEPPPRMRATPASHQSQFGEKMGEWFDQAGAGAGGTAWANFESDHCFDDFVSPMTNPFLNEDPRALTELRPMFMFQTIPNSNPFYQGGNIEYFGLQARLAITQRFSVVLHKLGGLIINSGSNSFVGSASGFAEIWIGPKYTFYRDEQTGTIAGAGLIFQVPVGPAKVYQDTGELSLVPYVNFAQRFGKTSYGTFHVMDTLGFSFRTNDQRSNYFYNSFHIDFDVANYGICPLLELNWFHYTQNGQASGLGFEGGDMANIGSAVAGRDYLFIAVGARIKASDTLQFGIATEFPLLGTQDLENFRLGVDMIWRY